MSRSTSNAFNDLPLSYSREQQSCLLLLELPQELLSQVTSNESPKLTLKSAVPATSSSRPAPDSPYAVICGASGTYRLRQVQSSNALLALNPVFQNEDLCSLSREMLVFASFTSMLEVADQIDPNADGAMSPLRWLEHLLPTYDGDPSSLRNTSSSSKATLFGEIPYSDLELLRAWDVLNAFELGPRAVKPSSSVLAKLWIDVYEAAAVHGIDLTKPLQPSNLWAHVKEAGHAQELFDVVIRQLSGDETGPTQEHINFKEDKTVMFVGQCLAADWGRSLKAEHFEQFRGSWRAVVPDCWHRTIDDYPSEALTAFAMTNNARRGGQGSHSGIAAQSLGKMRTSNNVKDWHKRLKGKAPR